MSRDELLSDLNYVKTMAEEGAQTPLLGGRIGLMWGILMSLTFIGHWAFVSGHTGLPNQYLGFLWLGFAIIGSLLTFILDKTLTDKPGLSSVGNRVDSTVWMFFGALMFSCFIGFALIIALGKASYPLFDFMVAIGFTAQGMAYGIVSKMSGYKWLMLSSIAGFISGIVSFALFGSTTLYLFAALGAIATIVIPEIIMLRGEPKNVV